MKRLMMAVSAALLSAVLAGAPVKAQQLQAAPLFPGGAPVSEEQVRAKLQSDGWSDVQIYRAGRYFQVTAVKDGQSARLAVNTQTGRVRGDDDDDDDD